MFNTLRCKKSKTFPCRSLVRTILRIRVNKLIEYYEVCICESRAPRMKARASSASAIEGNHTTGTAR